jgi:Xaa-Pro aminopeptidase
MDQTGNASRAAMRAPSALPAMPYAERRRRFVEQIGKAVAVLPAPPEALRNGDNEYRFRQDSDLLYLTGFAEPESVAVLFPGEAGPRFVLFVRPRDPERETWVGRRAGVEGAVRDFGAAEAYPIGELAQRLPALLEGFDVLYYGLGRNPAVDRTVLDTVLTLKKTRPRRGTSPVEIRDPSLPLGETRLLKEAPELTRMRRACQISAEAHVESLRAARPGMREFELEAILDYAFRARGASGAGYGTIVAGGANATILHYVENCDPLRDGDLLLVDAGCEFDAYCGDITRTFPVGAAFTRDQRAVYDVVLAAEQAAIAEVGPGKPFDAAHNRAVEILTQGLIDLGVLKGPLADRIADNGYKPFYMHRTSHWLGLDVHDAGLYVAGGQARVLEPGMILTIEPGLYFGDYCGEVDPRWRGIGIRVEDDVLVTATGCENLTAACPKEPAELEALRREALARSAV